MTITCTKEPSYGMARETYLISGKDFDAYTTTKTALNILPVVAGWNELYNIQFLFNVITYNPASLSISVIDNSHHLATAIPKLVTALNNAALAPEVTALSNCIQAKQDVCNAYHNIILASHQCPYLRLGASDHDLQQALCTPPANICQSEITSLMGMLNSLTPVPCS